MSCHSCQPSHYVFALFFHLCFLRSRCGALIFCPCLICHFCTRNSSMWLVLHAATFLSSLVSVGNCWQHHGWLRSLSIACADAQSTWSPRTSTSSTSTVLPATVWPHERVSPALSEHATTSESTKLVSQLVGPYIMERMWTPPPHLDSFHPLHQPLRYHLCCHIHHNNVHPRNRAHLPNRVHQHNRAHLAPSIHLSLSTPVDCNSEIKPDFPDR